MSFLKVINCAVIATGAYWISIAKDVTRRSLSKRQKQFCFSITGEIFDIHDKRERVAQLTIKRRKIYEIKLHNLSASSALASKKDANRKNEFQFSPINGMCHENANSIKFMCNFARNVADLFLFPPYPYPQLPLLIKFFLSLWLTSPALALPVNAVDILKIIFVDKQIDKYDKTSRLSQPLPFATTSTPTCYFHSIRFVRKIVRNVFEVEAFFKIIIR